MPEILEIKLAVLSALCRAHVTLLEINEAEAQAQVMAQSPLAPDLPGLAHERPSLSLKRYPVVALAHKRRWLVQGPYGVLEDNLPIQQSALPARVGPGQVLLLERSLTHQPGRGLWLGKRALLKRLWQESLNGLFDRRLLLRLPTCPVGLVVFEPGKVTGSDFLARRMLQRVLGRNMPMEPLLEDSFYETLGVPFEHSGLSAVRQTVMHTPPGFTTLTLVRQESDRTLLLVSQRPEGPAALPGVQLREKYVQEIHHRVKNNFQMAASLLRMQMRQYKDDPRIVEALGAAVSRLGSLTAVYDALSQEGTQTVHLPGLFRELAGGVMRGGTGGEAQVNVLCEVAYAPSDLAIKLALLVNELLSNALKHTQEGAVLKVEVTLTLNGPQAVLSVTDNGPGPPMGVDIAQAKGLGLRIVRSIVEEDLGGSLAFERAGGQTRVVAAMPRTVFSKG